MISEKSIAGIDDEIIFTAFNGGTRIIRQCNLKFTFGNAELVV